ncbi:uncharacterized protein METZ01_LOCUS17984 [marine metagenome]|uniref:Uncharacterized protein n=1 Tax=marine metagenome TaxID=408172 RepID=A0A381PDX2_9ZZZZ
MILLARHTTIDYMVKTFRNQESEPAFQRSGPLGIWAAFSAQRSVSWLSWMQPTAKRDFTALPVIGWLGLPGAERNRVANVSMTAGGCAFAGATGMYTTLKQAITG